MAGGAGRKPELDSARRLHATTGIRADYLEKVTGEAKFASDIVVPGMLHGAVLVADDDANARASLVGDLQQLGLTVVEAENGEVGAISARVISKIADVKVLAVCGDFFPVIVRKSLNINGLNDGSVGGIDGKKAVQRAAVVVRPAFAVGENEATRFFEDERQVGHFLRRPKGVLINARAVIRRRIRVEIGGLRVGAARLTIQGKR